MAEELKQKFQEVQNQKVKKQGNAIEIDEFEWIKVAVDTLKDRTKDDIFSAEPGAGN